MIQLYHKNLSYMLPIGLEPIPPTHEIDALTIELWER